MKPAVYYPFVYALEAHSGVSTTRRFATTIAHISNGYLPFERYIAAGINRMRERPGEDAIEELVSDWLPMCINPFSQFFRNIQTPKNLIAGMDALNAAVDLPTPIVFKFTSSFPRNSLVHPDTLAGANSSAPYICDLARVIGCGTLAKRLESRLGGNRSRHITKISEIACYFGLTHTATNHVAELYEQRGNLPFAEIASALGVHRRTLERRLREEGNTGEQIRQGVRLLRAAEMLRTQTPLTQVALDAGFHDLAHMNHAFHRSNGVAPSFFRRIAYGAVEPELD